MKLSQPAAVTLRLNEYEITLEDGRIFGRGPDRRVAQRLCVDLARLMRETPFGRRVYRQMIAGDPELLEALQQRLKILLGLPGSLETHAAYTPATDAQLAKAAAYGLAVDELTPVGDIARDLARFERLRLLIHIVWFSLTGKRTSECGINADHVNQLTRQLRTQPELMAEVQHARLRPLPTTADATAAAAAADSPAAWVLEPIEPGQIIEPRLGPDSLDRNDPVFRRLAPLLRQHWRRFLPRTNLRRYLPAAAADVVAAGADAPPQPVRNLTGS